ncbi:unnamed protein product [Tetraodon nigroviridis]|uniref:(spotted green pufferfish) hypothetical protein n=1 Tax=Tetraodon nigroviridis TaxID=99883 RepID=Q4S584_TETNG|nr:unnamed protein product [Tetraodon nigroviridis]
MAAAEAMPKPNLEDGQHFIGKSAMRLNGASLPSETKH